MLLIRAAVTAAKRLTCRATLSSGSTGLKVSKFSSDTNIFFTEEKITADDLKKSNKSTERVEKTNEKETESQRFHLDEWEAFLDEQKPELELESKHFGPITTDESSQNKRSYYSESYSQGNLFQTRDSESYSQGNLFQTRDSETPEITLPAKPKGVESIRNTLGSMRTNLKLDHLKEEPTFKHDAVFKDKNEIGNESTMTSWKSYQPKRSTEYPAIVSRGSYQLRADLGRVFGSSRKRDPLIFINGEQEILKIGNLGIKPKKIFFSRNYDMSEFLMPLDNVEVFKISVEDYKYWSSSSSGSGCFAIYRLEDLQKPGIRKSFMPLTVICNNITHCITLGYIINAAAICGTEFLLTSEDSAFGWKSEVIRASRLTALYMKTEFGLSWEEITQKIAPRQKVFLIHGPEQPTSRKSRFSQMKSTEIDYLPCVNIYNSNVWEENAAVLLISSTASAVTDKVMEFCLQHDSARINAANKLLIPATFFTGVIFEMRRQWIAKTYRTKPEKTNTADDDIELLRDNDTGDLRY